MFYLLRIWKFVRRNKLKTKKRKVVIAPEVLRQAFLEVYPKYRKYSTKKFTSRLKWFLKYGNGDPNYEDGYFFINPDSKFATPPPPTDEMPYLPPGFIE